MTHEENSYCTKKIFCNTLKELMKHKAFSKITVSELVRSCNVNRKTFYYHFEDIYDLLKWMLEQEAMEVVKGFDFVKEYKDAFLFVINYVEENSYVLNCIYDSVGRDELKRFFYQDFIGLIENIIKDGEEKLHVTLMDDFRMFLCNLYTESVAGMLINFFQKPESFDKEKLMEYFSVVMTNSIPAVLQAAGSKTGI